MPDEDPFEFIRTYRIARGYLIGMVAGMPVGALMWLGGQIDIVYSVALFSQLGAWLGWAIMKGRA